MHKNVKKCRNLKNRSFQLIHTQNMKKRGKHDISEKLFTLSTLKQVFFVNYFCEKKNGCFGVNYENAFLSKKNKKIIDF